MSDKKDMERQVHIEEDVELSNPDHVKGELPPVRGEVHAMEIVRSGGEEVDLHINELEIQLAARNVDDDSGWSKFLSFHNPDNFTKFLAAFACIGGLLCGIDQSLISGANLFMPSALNLTADQASLVNASVALGGMAGSLSLSPINELLGRRKAIMVSCLLYTIGAALEAGAMNFGMMVSGRLVLGMGIGIEVATVPIYVAETVPRKHRGNLVSLYQFNITLGEVLGFAVAAMFISVKGNWRYILGSSLVFSTILFVGMIFLPESPRYLMHKGHPLDAFRVWKLVRDIRQREAKDEFFVMMFSVREEAAGNRNRGKFAWTDYLTVARCRRAMIYSLVMGALGQLTGINAVMYYMAVLFSKVGFDAKDSVFMSLVGGGTLMLGVIPAIIFMERRGRRFWAITMVPCFFVGLLIIGLGYLIPLSHTGAAQGIYITGLVIYMFFFGPYATLSWIIPSEVYPTYLRSYGMTVYTTIAFVWIFVVTYNFSQMLEAMTKIGLTLGFYGGIAVIGWFYQIFFMPETHNKTLEEIDLVFQKPTIEIVKENARNSWETAKDLAHFRLRKVFLTRS
ncbi:uncharacterized protein PV07_11994 [Cladophialophora immunda]|uniref:Major facilitator superfamily (MFS) profile domain-containing protein n=1 Tax=Cladophialophora immunda TaxID=569365 RepID=A0A0D2CJR9_9EURO|nr:uncharacterized protein PV07_11994 [Cladophialophora immunda]KIW23824.1 hypothetical protein PV07_11994 [Cladophialophora immunda]OQU95516.1 hypothetical protein CLAIMM_01705 [Cladophialophora immunda]